MSDKRVNVTVRRIESIGKGRFRVKIAENNINLVDLDYSKDLYLVVTKNLGRGRYVMKKVEKKAETIFERIRRFRTSV